MEVYKKRDNTIDLIRFVAITMVVMHHYFLYGIRTTDCAVLPINKQMSDVIAMFCRVNVNLFYLISGYLLAAKDTIDWKKTFIRVGKLWGTIFCFSVFIYIGLLTSDLITFNPKIFVGCLFPMLTSKYWFMTVFIGLCLITPFLQVLYSALDKRNVAYLSLALLFFDSIIDFSSTSRGFDIFHGLTMITVGYAVKTYWSDIKQKKLFVGWYVMFIILGVGLTAVGHRLVGPDFNQLWYNDIFVVLASVSFFIWLKNLTVKTTIFSKVGPYVLGIYLINDHPVMRSVVYRDILHCPDFYTSPYYFLHFVVSILAFIICGLVADYVITKLIVNPISKRLTA